MTHVPRRTRWWLFAGLVAWLPVLLAGCVEHRATRRDAFFEKWKIRAEHSRGHSPGARTERPEAAQKRASDRESTPPARTAAARPVAPPSAAKTLPKDLLSMKMHNVDLPVLLRALAANARQNIMVSENVKGKATLNIHRAPWDQVFLGLLRTHGLTYRWEGDIIRILAKEDFENDLKLMEANRKKQEYELQMRTLMAQADLLEPLQTRVVHVRYADPKKLRENLWEFLRAGKAGSGLPEEEKMGTGADFRGAVLVDPHTHSLMIQATAKDIDRLTALIKQLDRPTPQILIEAHIVETTKEMARQLGVQWGGLYRKSTSGDNYWITPGANTTQGLGGTVDEDANPTSGVGANFPAEFLKNPVPNASGLTLGFLSQKVGEYLLSVELSALEEAGKLNILSSPSITTLDNLPATIESGKEVPFQTVENDEVKIEWKKAVLSLEVTPHVIDGETLKLQIKTHKDELDFSNTVQGNPTIITKNAETHVVLFDGETTVIGGLSREIMGDSEAGVPGLMHLPVLGYLFKSRDRKNDMEEVLIFITPHVLEERGPEPATAGPAGS